LVPAKIFVMPASFMDIRASINTVRKFWNFLEGLYPFLGSVRQRAAACGRRLVEAPPVKNLLKRLSESSQAAAVKSLGESFLWRDLSKQRLQLQNLPPDVLAILRPLFLACLFLVLLLPLTWVWVWPVVPASALEGTETPIAGWSVLLWAICTAMGWGALLGGTGAANRTSFTVAAIFFQYVFAIITVDLEASGVASLMLVFCRWWIGLSTLWAAAVCQRRLSARGRSPLLYSLASCCLVGIVSGIFLWRSLPISASFPGQNLSFGIVFGCCLGVSTHYAARARREALFARLFFEPFQPLARTVYALMLCNGVSLLIPLAARGLPDFTQSLLLGHKYLMTHFWPLWYFIGVGIIFRILKRSKVVAQSAGAIVRPAVFVSATVMFFFAGFIITGCYRIFMSWSSMWPQWLTIPAYHVYSWTKDYIWQKPVLSFTMEWMFLVFTFDMAAVGWLASLRRLNAERLKSLLFLNLLSFLLIYEYFFQSFSFMRAPGHSMTLYALFSFWLLWLVQSNTYSVSSKSSPSWPSEARMAIFGSAILFALLEIHARTAIHDFQAMTEVFWFMYRGIVDVGVPFGLYVYARRRLGHLPIPVSHIFAAFCAGAALTIPLNFLDHLIMAGGSWSQMSRELSVLIGRSFGFSRVLPVWWGMVRAVLVVAVLAVAAFVLKRSGGSGRSPAVPLFSVITVGLGLTAFSNTRISLLLPFIPSHWEWYWQPIYSSPLIEYSLVFLYLAYGLPTLIVGLAASANHALSLVWWTLGIAGGLLVHVGICWIWPAHKPFLVASGLAGTVALAGAALGVLLMDRVRFRVEAVMPEPSHNEILPTDSTSRSDLSRGVAFRTKLGMMMAFLSVLGVAGYFQWQSAQTGSPLEEARLEWLTVPIPVPHGWQPLPAGNSTGARSAVFIAPTAFSTRSILVVSGEYQQGDTIIDLISRMEGDDSSDSYRRSEIEDWRRYYPAAMALHYSLQRTLEDGSTSAITGLSVFLPIGVKEVVVLTFLDSPENRDARVLDMIRMVKSASLAWPGPARFTKRAIERPSMLVSRPAGTAASVEMPSGLSRRQCRRTEMMAPDGLRVREQACPYRRSSMRA